VPIRLDIADNGQLINVRLSQPRTLGD